MTAIQPTGRYTRAAATAKQKTWKRPTSSETAAERRVSKSLSGLFDRIVRPAARGGRGSRLLLSRPPTAASSNRRLTPLLTKDGKPDMAQIKILDLDQAPEPDQVRGSRKNRDRKVAYEQFIQTLPEGKVGELTVDAGETVRAVALRLHRAALRLDVGIAAWTVSADPDTVYFRVTGDSPAATVAGAPAPLKRRTVKKSA